MTLSDSRCCREPSDLGGSIAARPLLYNGAMTWWRAVLAFFLAASGCTGTAVPQPPNLTPVDPTLLNHSTQEDMGQVLSGDPGAAPPGVEVWIWELENAEPPLVAASGAEGGFLIRLPRSLSGEVRLQARAGRDRSIPSDATVSGIDLIPVEQPSCLVVPPEVELTDRSARIALDNDCDGAVELTSFQLRAGEPALTIEAPGSATLPAGSRIELRARAAGVATVEDILFVNATVEGAPVRYPVTVIALGAP